MSRPTTHFDHHDPSLRGDELFSTYADLQDRCPVAWSEAHDGFWVLTRYADVKAALRDHRTFSSAQGVHIPRDPDVPPFIPIDFDPPEHRHYRRLFERILDADVVKAHEPALRELIGGLLDRVVDAGGGDLVEHVAVPLPLQVLGLLLGLSDRTAAQLRALTADMWASFGKEGDAPDVAGRLIELMMGEVAERRRNPRDDYLTWLASAEVDGRPITEQEIASTLLVLAVAGHETTVNTVGSVLLHLARHPELQQRVRRDPDVIPVLCEELLRLHTPAQLFARTLTEDHEVRGVTMAAGDRVALVYAAADRDPAEFEEPGELSLEGRPRRHLAFGWGVHHCVGAHLARRELRTLLEELRSRPPFVLDGDPAMTGLIGGHHMGVHRLPVRFS